jgi:hypothetical protein
MDRELSDRLTRLIQETDLARRPLLISDGARLLSEVQDWEAKGERLNRRLAALEKSALDPNAPGEAPTSLADWAYAILLDEGAAMPYREIAAAIKARGFRHAREPKNPERQLADSVWSAMHLDDRFTKVGRGIFELTERL